MPSSSSFTMYRRTVRRPTLRRRDSSEPLILPCDCSSSSTARTRVVGQDIETSLVRIRVACVLIARYRARHEAIYENLCGGLRALPAGRNERRRATSEHERRGGNEDNGRCQRRGARFRLLDGQM